MNGQVEKEKQGKTGGCAEKVGELVRDNYNYQAQRIYFPVVMRQGRIRGLKASIPAPSGPSGERLSTRSGLRTIMG